MPPGFQAISGVQEAELVPLPPWEISPPETAAQRRGLAYERKAHAHFERKFSERYLASPWFHYTRTNTRGLSRSNFCQPDGLLFDIPQGRIIILEMKLRHTPDAWWQLFYRYIPVVKAAYPGFELEVCEVTPFLDPAVRCPEPPVLCSNPWNPTPGAFNVHCFRG